MATIDHGSVDQQITVYPGEFPTRHNHHTSFNNHANDADNHDILSYNHPDGHGSCHRRVAQQGVLLDSGASYMRPDNYHEGCGQGHAQSQGYNRGFMARSQSEGINAGIFES